MKIAILSALLLLFILNDSMGQTPQVIRLVDFKDEITTGRYENSEPFKKQKMDSVQIEKRSNTDFVINIDCSRDYKYGILFDKEFYPVGPLKIIVNNRVYLYDLIKDEKRKKNWQFNYPLLFLDIKEMVRKQLSQSGMQFCELMESGAKVQIQYTLSEQAEQYYTITFKSKNTTISILSDPRQYISIHEKKSNSSTSSPIWWLTKQNATTNGVTNSTQRLVPFQKFKFVDISSNLEIHFDQEALSKNINLQGSVSVEARSNNKKIEVSPYSLIGEERISFGVNAMPIKEIADYFLRLMIESTLYNRMWDRYTLSELGMNDPASKDRLVNYQIDQFESAKRILLKALEKMETKNEELDSVIKNDDFANYLIADNIGTLSKFWPDADLRLILFQINQKSNPSPYTYRELLEVIRRFPAGNEIIRTDNENSLDVKDVLVKELKSKSEKAQLIHELLKRIKESNEQTINAFLSLTVLTTTDFNELYRKIEENILELNKIKVSTSMKREEANFNYEKLYEINEVLRRFIDGSVLFQNLLTNNNYTIEENYLDFFLDTTIVKKKDITSLTTDLESYSRIREVFAQSAGQEIFKKLVFATIDLSNAGLSDGDQVEINVLWINANGSAGRTDQLTELATASFIVKKTGWHLDVSESALLIHRIDEEKLRSGYPLSPSNFKPTAGASLLWSYYNPYRTAMRVKKHGPKKDQLKEYGFLKFLHWLEPSFGINVSYLDFRTDRDFEFGAAPIIGLFQNRIFLTTGYNFNVNGESPFYMGIGFSFSNIYKRINKSDNE